MTDQRSRFFSDIRKFLCRQLSHVFFLQQRVFPVQIGIRENLLDQLDGCRSQQIQIKIGYKQQKRDLRQHRSDLGQSQHIGLNIILLLRIRKTVLVCHKIRTHRIEQKNQVVSDQIGVAVNSHRVLNDIFQKRHQRKAHDSDHQSDHPVGFLIKLHISLDRFLIASCHRPVQAEVDCRSQPQLRQGKHGKDAGIGAVHAKQGFSQLYDEYLL